MLKERARLIAVSVFCTDLLLVTLAFLLSFWIRDSALPWVAPDAFPGHLYPLDRYLPLLPFGLTIWAATLVAARSYRSHRMVPLIEEAWTIVRVSATSLVAITLGLWVLRLDRALLGDDWISRTWLVVWAALACLLLLGERIGLRVTSRYIRSRGFNYRTVLVIGNNVAARSVARALTDHPHWGFRVLGFATTRPSKATSVGPWPILGTVEEVPRIVDEHVVDDVIMAATRRDLDELEDLFLGLHEQGIRTFFTLNFFPHTKAKVDLSEIDGLPMLTFSTAPSSPLLLAIKRGMDLVLTTVCLACAFPVLAAVALLIKATSGGEVLFRQTRCGLNGRRFTLYKFRTMIEGAEARRAEVLHLNEMNGPVFKVRDDPRVTRLGRLLRRFSLDELPQLLNVLRGDMSLVGPRPPIPEEVAQYQRWQRRRLSMKPGLTCLWQISGRNQVDFNEWMELDLEYIDSWSPLLDLKILLKTIPVVLTGRGAS